MRLFASLVGLFVAVFVLANSIPALAEEDIFFISSENELTTALEQKDTLKGLAVSINFYNSTTLENQGKMDGLVIHIISLVLRPVYLYGQPFDRELAQRLLVSEDGSNCMPTAFAGIFPREDNRVLRMCGADDNPRDEARFREWISSYWKNAKKFFFRNKD